MPIRWFPEECEEAGAGWLSLMADELRCFLEGKLPVQCPRTPAWCVYCIAGIPEDRLSRYRAMAHLCVELLNRVHSGDDQGYLTNLFELGQELQEGELLLPALNLECRVNTGMILLSPKLQRSLRWLIIKNQQDESLHSRWIASLQTKDGTFEELLDAFSGLVWLPGEYGHPPLTAIREGLPILAAALAEREGGEAYLAQAIRLLRETYPSDRWAKWLAPDVDSWDPWLKRIAHNAFPML